MNKKTGGPEELIACSICGRAGTWINYLVWFLSVVVGSGQTLLRLERVGVNFVDPE